MRGSLCLLLLFLGMASGRAASFDCKAARSPTEQAICGNSDLSRLDGELAQAYAAAMASVPRPTALRDVQRDWIVRVRDKAPAGTLRHVLEARLTELRAIDADARTLRKPVTADSLGTRCISLRDDPDETCKVDSLGRIQNGPGGALAWQIQSYHQDNLRTAAGVVVLSVLPGGQFQPVVWDAAEDAYFGEPRLVATPAGRLLDLNGSLDGTGNLSVESLYQFTDGAWHEVDLTAWPKALSARLPKGLAIWKGVYPDWKTMTAASDLWRDRDANCCPSGGSVHVTLALADGRITLTGMTLSHLQLP